RAWRSTAEADADAGADRPVGRVAGQRRHDRGIEGHPARRPPDDAGVEDDRVAALALLARGVDQVGEQRDALDDGARQAAADDGLPEIARGPVPPDRLHAAVL